MLVKHGGGVRPCGADGGTKFKLPQGICSVVCSAPRAPQFSFDERVHQLVRAGARRGQPLPDWLILCLTDWLIHGFGFAGQMTEDVVVSCPNIS